MSSRPYAQQDLAIQVEVGEAHHTLRLSGELDLRSLPQLEAAIARVLPYAKRIVVDVERVSFIDSSGLSLLLESRRRCADRGVDFVLTRGAPPVARLLEVTGLLDRLPMLRRRRGT